MIADSRISIDMISTQIDALFAIRKLGGEVVMDKEWVALIVEAKQLGLTAEEVSNFLTNKGGKING
ncbi:hypothetical protein X953_09955 [Virgibacillus sp. SK37]|nr:hypothetical protein X953_09955 [Virgibacillus sp. SK37]